MEEIIVASVSIVISIIALVYTFISNTKKYELKYQHRNEIISWYSETDRIIMLLLHDMGSGGDEYQNRIAQLSNQIEVGRLFYPNIVEDDFGRNKPSAYQGYRNTIIEVLVMLYDIMKNNYNQKYYMHGKTLQRVYTSYVFDSLKVREFNKEIVKITGHKFDDKNIEDYLSTNSDQNKLYQYFNN